MRRAAITDPTGRPWLAGRYPGGVLELLAYLHDLGGAVTATGGKRASVHRAQRAGLVVLITDAAAPRASVSCQLVDAASIRNLAARCSAALRTAMADAEQRGERYAGLHWRMIPRAVPTRAWAPGATACPRCRCNPDRPCTVILDGGCGTAACAPAGLYGAATCSGCGDTPAG